MRRPRDEDPFLRSQADLMAGVAGVFFVLMAVFLTIVAARNLEDKKALEKYEHIDKSEQEASAAVVNALEGIKTDLEQINPGGASISGNELVINLDPGGELLKFESGDDELPCDTRERTRNKMKDILNTTCAGIMASKVRLIYRIVLEGHTDNKPVTNDLVQVNHCGAQPRSLKPTDQRVRAFGGNVALSSRRAVNVLRLVVEDVDTSEVLRNCVDTYFLVSGRGPVDPLEAKAGQLSGTIAMFPGCAAPVERLDSGPAWLIAQNRAAAEKNRRVVLRVIGRQDIKQLVEDQKRQKEQEGTCRSAADRGLVSP